MMNGPNRDINFMTVRDLTEGNEDPFSTAETYDEDLELFLELGLRPFKLPLRQRLHVGTARIQNQAIVEVYVECLPAQFWFFEIHMKEPKRLLKLGTGSGSLLCYWPIIVAFATDMIAVKEYKTKEEPK